MTIIASRHFSTVWKSCELTYITLWVTPWGYNATRIWMGRNTVMELSFIRGWFYSRVNRALGRKRERERESRACWWAKRRGSRNKTGLPGLVATPLQNEKPSFFYFANPCARKQTRLEQKWAEMSARISFQPLRFLASTTSAGITEIYVSILSPGRCNSSNASQLPYHCVVTHLYIFIALYHI